MGHGQETRDKRVFLKNTQGCVDEDRSSGNLALGSLHKMGFPEGEIRRVYGRERRIQGFLKLPSGGGTQIRNYSKH